MVPLSLFSYVVTNSKKDKMAKKLMLLQPETLILLPSSRYSVKLGKPYFPVDVNMPTSLCDLINRNYWFFFQNLQIDSSFLLESSMNWSDFDSNQNGLENVGYLNAVNDCTERGIKFTSYYLPSARSEIHFQNVLQVVEQDRR